MSSPGHSGDALTKLRRATLTSREKCNCNARARGQIHELKFFAISSAALRLSAMSVLQRLVGRRDLGEAIFLFAQRVHVAPAEVGALADGCEILANARLIVGDALCLGREIVASRLWHC